MNIVTKLVLVLVSILFSYLMFYSILSSLFAPQQTFSMMNIAYGSSNNQINIVIISLLGALIVGVLVAAYLDLIGNLSNIDKQQQTTEKNAEQKPSHIEIMMNAMNEDERKVIGEIKTAGEITQDSLRFRLGWSKAKLSTILSHLDRLGIIQKERSGKTYRVFIQKSLEERF